MTTTALDTTNWVSYPFTINGINFVSKLDPQGSFYPQVERLPAGVFTAENIRMLTSMVGDPTKLSAKELQDELDLCNLGASQAVICLA